MKKSIDGQKSIVLPQESGENITEVSKSSEIIKKEIVRILKIQGINCYGQATNYDILDSLMFLLLTDKEEKQKKQIDEKMLLNKFADILEIIKLDIQSVESKKDLKDLNELKQNLILFSMLENISSNDKISGLIKEITIHIKERNL
ncbi:MAG: hypothetical protein PHN31_01325 [Candidatus Gracilibacteria bacterium]|nr:hypothetical protein [Candidatus Gracilibacteria bacterium]